MPTFIHLFIETRNVSKVISSLVLVLAIRSCLFFCVHAGCCRRNNETSGPDSRFDRSKKLATPAHDSTRHSSESELSKGAQKCVINHKMSSSSMIIYIIIQQSTKIDSIIMCQFFIRHILISCFVCI